MKNKNIELFNKWAITGKDISMEKGHTPSVNQMIKIISNKSVMNEKEFNFLDLGCGNGWVIRKILKNKLCNLAVGVDGAKNMIDNAQAISDEGIYSKCRMDFATFFNYSITVLECGCKIHSAFQI